MKIVQVVPRMQSGGVERGTLEIARALAHAGHEPIVVSEGGDMVVRLESENIRHVWMGVAKKSLGALFVVNELAKFLKGEKVDVVHCRSRLPAWLTLFALRRMTGKRPRFVTSVQGLHSVSRYSAVISRGERIEVVSHTARDYLLSNYAGVDPNKIRLILRGIEPSYYSLGFEPSEEWSETWTTEMQSLNPNSLPILTLAGRVSRLKGHNEFLSILESLIGGGFPCIGLIVGAEDRRHERYAAALKKRVQESKLLRENIRFTGFRSDVREIFSVSDFVLSLSQTPESFGRTVLEALSLGTPVVAFDHGGVGEILRELYPQGAVQFGDNDAVSSRIVELSKNVGCIKSHDMTLDRMCRETISMYEELA